MKKKPQIKLNRQVETKSAQEFASRQSIKYIETSASTGANVEKSFFDLAHRLLKQQKEKQEQGAKIASSQPFKIVLLGEAGICLFIVCLLFVYCLFIVCLCLFVFEIK